MSAANFDLFNPRPSGWDAERDAHAIIARAVERWRPSHVFAGFSGGHDSLCAAHIASQHPAFSGCVHIDTGTGIPETRAFVESICERFGWPLKVYTPPMPKDARDGESAYEAIVRRWGFPGPSGHTVMYNRLKERALRQFTREHKRTRRDRIVLVTGVRLAESRRRMGTGEETSRDGARVWCAPLLRWESSDKHAYMAQHDLPANPVVELLCMSGECLCGAFAHPGELDEIATWFPDTAEKIRALESRIAASGQPACKWGVRPPKEQNVANEAQGDMALCWSCEAKRAAIAEDAA